MLDPTMVAVGASLFGSVAAGPAVAYGVEQLPHEWRRRTEWLVIGLGLAAAVLLELLPGAPGATVLVYLLAALPGLLAFLAFRTLYASAVVSLAPLYFVIGALGPSRPAHAPVLALDSAFPVEPAWMLVYGSLYAFIVLLPLFVVRDRELFRRTMQGYLAVILVSYVGFLLYPTVGPRPAAVPAGGFWPWTLQIAYSLDTPYNCFPSLHVAYSFVSALACYRVHRGIGVVAVLWASLIGVSTLFTKQHYIADVVAGVVAASVAYALFLRSYPREAITEQDRRQAPVRALVVAAIFVLIVAGFWTAYLIQTAVLG